MIMKYYKNVVDGFILSISRTYGITRIKADEYNAILSKISAIPDTPEGYQCLLVDGTLEWELVELPPEPAPDPEENI